MSPLLSIVIPTFNSERYLGECIASALAQTNPDVEVIIDDNASRDGTLAVAKSFASDARLRVFPNREDLNIPHGWNRAVSHARGEYVLLLHSDNVLHPRYAEQVLGAATTAGARVAFSDCVYFEGETPEGLFADDSEAPPFDCLAPGPSAVAYAFRFQRMIPTSGLAIHRSCLASRPPYDPRFRWDPDIEQMVWLASRFGVLRVHRSLAGIRTHAGQAASWRDPDFSRQYRELLTLAHEAGRTERHHFRLEWAESNQYIAQRLCESGAPARAVIRYCGRWFCAELAVLRHFAAHFLRKQKRCLESLLGWAAGGLARGNKKISPPRKLAEHNA